MNKIIEHYKGLDKKEKNALQIGALALLLFIIYQFVFTPFSESLEKITKQRTFQLSLNQWLKNNIPKTIKEANQKNTITLVSSQLLSNTDNDLKKSMLASLPYELSQSDKNSIQLSFKKVPYVDYIDWLENFFKRRSLTIKEINLTHLKESGMVSANLRFELK